MFLYKKLAVLAVVVLLGVPSVSMAGSFVVSLTEGKTPAEAVQVIAEQLDALFGRVQELETEQAKSAEDIETLQEENERLKSALEGKADVVVPKDQTPECLALKAQIEAIEAQYEVPQSLADERRALAKELLEVKRSVVKVEDNDVEAWRQMLQDIEDKKEAIERQIEVVDVKVEALEEQSRQATAPLLEKAQKDGCLRG